MGGRTNRANGLKESSIGSPIRKACLRIELNTNAFAERTVTQPGHMPQMVKVFIAKAHQQAFCLL